MTYYLYIGNEVQGPYDGQMIRILLDSGDITIQTLCCLKGAENWEAVSTIPGFLEEFRPNISPGRPNHPVPSSTYSVQRPQAISSHDAQRAQIHTSYDMQRIRATSSHSTVKPKQVETGVNLYYKTIAFNALWSIPVIIKESIDGTGDVAVGILFVWILFLAFLSAFQAFFVWKTDQGRNWARITLLVLLILGTIANLVIYGAQEEPLDHTVGRDILVTIAEIVATVYLFLPESSAWFRAKKQEREYT